MKWIIIVHKISNNTQYFHKSCSFVLFFVVVTVFSFWAFQDYTQKHVQRGPFSFRYLYGIFLLQICVTKSTNSIVCYTEVNSSIEPWFKSIVSFLLFFVVCFYLLYACISSSKMGYSNLWFLNNVFEEFVLLVVLYYNVCLVWCFLLCVFLLLFYFFKVESRTCPGTGCQS